MIIACLALFMASAGTSIAAKHYLITSTKQIKPSVLAKLKGAKGPRGSQGPRGIQGATGAAGPAGLTSISSVESTAIDLPVSSYVTPIAYCPSGTYAIGTGFDNSIGYTAYVWRYSTFVAAFFYTDSVDAASGVQVEAICAAGAGITSSSSAAARAKDLKQFAADKARAISANPSLKPLPSKS